MSSAKTHASFESTSAAGAMLIRHARGPVLVGVMLVGLGTSTTLALPAELVSRSLRPVHQTTAGSALMSETEQDRARAALAELRRLSGLTWEQLARLFQVSRRSLHFWASGKSMSPENEEHLYRLLATIQKLDRGSAGANRSLLLAIHDDGLIPFDLLARCQYERALALTGSSDAPPPMAAAPIAEEARAARAPRPPEELVDALQDRVHVEKGRLLAARPIRTSREK